MPRPKSQPSYRRHKARNVAVVTINGKNHYLGPWQSPESHEQYAALIAEWRRNGGTLPAPASPAATPAHAAPLTVSELILAYFRFAQTLYVKHGRPTSEQGCIKQALRFARQLYGAAPASDFGPRALKNVRQAMVAAGRARKSVNKDVHRVKRMVRWAVEEELLPAAVYQGLRCVAPLAKGKTAARETGNEVPHEWWTVGKRCKLSSHGDTPMAGTRKVYTPEFKLRAVRMITEQKLSVAEVARRLGVTENRLHEWKKALATKGADAFPGSGHLTPHEEEVRKLRAEVKRLEAERDILKKATAFFATQTN